MHIDYAFFADAAAVPPDAKFYALGGGFSSVGFPQLPARYAFAVVTGFRFGPGDLGQRFEFEVRLVDWDDKLVVPAVPIQIQLGGQGPPDGREMTAPAVTYLQAMFAEPGTYRLEHWAVDRRVHSMSLIIDEQTTPQVGPGAN